MFSDEEKMFIFGMLKYDFLDFYILFPFFVLFSWEIVNREIWQNFSNV